MLNCALISGDEGFRHRVMAAVRRPEAQARLVLDLPTFAERITGDDVASLAKAGALIAFVDLGKDLSGVEGIRLLSHEAPDVALVVAGPELPSEGLLTVIRAGATEYLPRPFSNGDVDEAFTRVLRRSRLVQAEAAPEPGRITTVFSAKGGTGVTTVASNLAVGLHRLTQLDTLLIDLAPSMGTAALALGLEPRYTHSDLIQNFHRLDEELFRSFLEAHESGVQVLASPASPSEAVPFSMEDVQNLIRLGQRFFEFTVIDGGSTFTDQLLAALQGSDDRLMVVTPDIPAMRNLRRTIDVFGATNGKAPFRLVLNQYREGVGLTPRDVEEGLGQPMAAILEKDDLAILASINAGRPEVLSGKSRISKGLMELSRDIAGPDHVQKPQKGLLGRIFKASAGKGGGKEKV